MGTRLRPYSDLTPKPMFTLAGRPLLDWHIRNLAAAGCEAVAVNTHHLNESIEAFVNHQSYPIPVIIRHEPRLLGTGGAIRNLADFWDERPFLVINADIFHDYDLAAVYRFHRSHSHPVTLVLCDEPRFNSVTLDANRHILSFERIPAGLSAAGHRQRTFTGIQVLDPTILDYLPSAGPSHSIDAFRRMMAAGHVVKACLPGAGTWVDLGTPERYRTMARKMTARAGFAEAFGENETADISFEPLSGDGSQRHWYRLRSGRRSLILCDHGLRVQKKTSEVDAFVAIGTHLKDRGLPVPQIHFHDRFAGLVVLEDLGDRHLQAAVRQSKDTEELNALYRQVISSLVNLSQEGIEGFDPAWAYQSECYDRELILDRECRYFVEAFVGGYLGISVDTARLASEFEHLADNALKHALMGFMHRDLQSRNIMATGDRLVMIDFQAGRRGPLQYDLASLLIDPYVELPEELQAGLLEYAAGLASRRCGIASGRFRHSYRYCALARNLQILGAFGFLCRVKGKTDFEAYIRPATNSLERQLARTGDEFPALGELVRRQIVPRLGGRDGSAAGRGR